VRGVVVSLGAEQTGRWAEKSQQHCQSLQAVGRLPSEPQLSARAEEKVLKSKRLTNFVDSYIIYDNISLLIPIPRSFIAARWAAWNANSSQARWPYLVFALD
jgi:hypothetical protein